MDTLHLRNDALSVHLPAGDQYLTTNGSNWLFTATAIFGVSVVSIPSLLPSPSLLPLFPS